MNNTIFRTLGAPLLTALRATLLTSLLAACSPLALVNAVSPGGAAEASQGIRYGAGERRLLDVYRPKTNAAQAPVIVFFYGGNWVSGERKDYAFVGRACARRACQ